MFWFFICFISYDCPLLGQAVTTARELVYCNCLGHFWCKFTETVKLNVGLRWFSVHYIFYHLLKYSPRTFSIRKDYKSLNRALHLTISIMIFITPQVITSPKPFMVLPTHSLLLTHAFFHCRDLVMFVFLCLSGFFLLCSLLCNC